MNIILFAVAIFSLSCQKENKSSQRLDDNTYDSIPSVKAVIPAILETSGIADSKINPGHLWLHEDSGNPPQLQLIKHDGSVVKRINIKGAVNRDWEDMALVGTQIYIADIGDNSRVFTNYTFYIFDEPSISTDTVKTFSAVQFKYADGAHDAEAFLVDPQSKDIYIITKNDKPSNVYKLSYPYSTSSINTANPVGKLGYTGVVSAALSPNGKEIIVKTYTGLFQYLREGSEPIEQALTKQPKSLPYVLEPQGEAITFANDHTGYFTLSEKGFSDKVNLYFYKRK